MINVDSVFNYINFLNDIKANMINDIKINDIVEGKTCGWTDPHRTALFKILEVKENQNVIAIRLIDQRKCGPDNILHKSNWRLIKRNGKTICNECGNK